MHAIIGDEIGQVADLQEILGQGIAKLGMIPSLALRAMDLEIATGQFESALSRIGVLQKTAPRPEPWMAKRAAVLTQAGQLAEARVAWEALLARNRARKSKSCLQASQV